MRYFFSTCKDKAKVFAINISICKVNSSKRWSHFYFYSIFIYHNQTKLTNKWKMNSADMFLHCIILLQKNWTKTITIWCEHNSHAPVNWLLLTQWACIQIAQSALLNGDKECNQKPLINTVQIKQNTQKASNFNNYDTFYANNLHTHSLSGMKWNRMIFAIFPNTINIYFGLFTKSHTISHQNVYRNSFNNKNRKIPYKFGVYLWYHKIELLCILGV